MATAESADSVMTTEWFLSIEENSSSLSTICGVCCYSRFIDEKIAGPKASWRLQGQQANRCLEFNLTLGCSLLASVPFPWDPWAAEGRGPIPGGRVAYNTGPLREYLDWFWGRPFTVPLPLCGVSFYELGLVIRNEDSPY